MDSTLSDKIIVKKKKKNKRSPISETYGKFLKKENVNLSPTKKTKPLEELKIKVIKSPEIHVEKKPCKRKRVKINSDGSPDKNDMKYNEDCEKKKQEKKENGGTKKKYKRTERKRRKSKKNKKIMNKSTNIRKSTLDPKQKGSSRSKLKLKEKEYKKIKRNVSPSKKDIKKAENMSDNSIKNELLKKGIEIKGNHKKLLRDIYLFTNLGGIKIHKE